MCGRCQQVRMERRRPRATMSLPDQCPHSGGPPQTAPTPLPISVSDHLPSGPQEHLQLSPSWAEAAPTAHSQQGLSQPYIHQATPAQSPTVGSCYIRNGIGTLVALQLRIGLASKGTWAQPLVGNQYARQQLIPQHKQKVHGLQRGRGSKIKHNNARE